MSSPQIFGRNRDSLTIDIQEELHELFTEHPRATVNEYGKPVIPGAALPDILGEFSQSHDSLELLDKNGQDALIGFIAANPQIEVTPDVLMNFIVQLAGMTPSPPPKDDSSPADGHDTTPQRGRDTERTEYEYYNRSRSSSRDSIGTSVYRPQSRASSKGPAVPPKTPVKDSPFDTSKRQRSQPLQGAPSSWTRRPPPSRRRSDAGMQGRASSDTEVCDALLRRVELLTNALVFRLFPACGLLSLTGRAWPSSRTFKPRLAQPIHRRRLWPILARSHQHRIPRQW